MGTEVIVNGESAPAPAEPDRFAWFDAARFGLFIHWGLYAIPAGEWKGRTDHGEWFMLEAKMSVAEYALFADQFNPVRFDAEEWVRVAKDAGMRYMVVTAKHHDGFALWDSAENPFNIVRATPFKRDVFKELSDACREAGLKFCVYYSDTDWRDPNFPAEYNPSHFHGNPSPTPDMDAYLASVKAQLRELLTNYGEIGIVWFDYGAGFVGYDLGTAMKGQEIVDLIHSLQPNCLVNNRVGVPGDYGTPEQEIPTDAPRTPWETCMTMSRHWCHTTHDPAWKSAESLIRNLIEIASKGGNYLLNNGPRADGAFPPESLERLAAIADWMRINSEAIHGTGPTAFGAEMGEYSPTEKDANGKPVFVARREWRCTTKPGRLYLHLLEWPQSEFVLSDVKGTVTRGYLLADPERSSLPLMQNGGTVTVRLPALAPSPIASVLCLETKPL
ncbi:MAG: alpha-L-fucosidase [Cytophagales bacterium]|nr:alpha-L-fucosidase [Armatimonadota bacterium]